MLEIATNGIDKNEIVQKIEKLDGYIRKAKMRLVKHESDLELLYTQQYGDKEVIEKSLKKLKLLSKRRSMR